MVKGGNKPTSFCWRAARKIYAMRCTVGNCAMRRSGNPAPGLTVDDDHVALMDIEGELARSVAIDVWQLQVPRMT